MKNIAFVWWWTWGHVFPIKTLVDYINNSSYKWEFKNTFWIWEKNSLEESVSNGIVYDNFKFLTIMSWKLRRYLDFKAIIQNILDIAKLLIGFFQSIFIILKYKIDIIFCKWGYVCLPFVFAWKLLWKQIFVHESDSVAWLTNKISSYFSKLNFVWFDNALKNSLNVWQILSNDLVEYDEDTIDKSIFNQSYTTLLVIWWSQWAKVLYESILRIINDKKYNNMNIIVILWLKNIELKNKFSKFSNVKIFDFVTQKQLWLLYNISDIAITRGGATSLAEMHLFWIKLLIVPLPYTWWNHQFYNALHYQKNYNDVLIPQDVELDQNLKIHLDKLLNYKKNINSNIDIEENLEIILKNIVK